MIFTVSVLSSVFLIRDKLTTNFNTAPWKSYSAFLIDYAVTSKYVGNFSIETSFWLVLDLACPAKYSSLTNSRILFAYSMIDSTSSKRVLSKVFNFASRMGWDSAWIMVFDLAHTTLQHLFCCPGDLQFWLTAIIISANVKSQFCHSFSLISSYISSGACSFSSRLTTELEVSLLRLLTYLNFCLWESLSSPATKRSNSHWPIVLP